MSNSDSENFKLMKKLQRKLNGELGDVWWNLYVAGAFWSNISTPINLAITLLSAVTAGQATTSNMLSQSAFFKISIASLIISTLNTFFRPHAQLMGIMDSMKSINDLGFKFETIYYSECNNETDYTRRYKEYKQILMDLNKFQQSKSPDQQNFCTDFVYWLFKNYSCLKKNYKWLDLDMAYIDEQANNTNKTESNPNQCCYCEPCSDCCIPKVNELNVQCMNKTKEEENNKDTKNNLSIRVETIQPNNIRIADEENQYEQDSNLTDSTTVHSQNEPK